MTDAHTCCQPTVRILYAVVNLCEDEWHTAHAVGVREYVYILKMHKGGVDGTKRCSLRTALFLWKPGISIAAVPSGMFKEGGKEGK